MKRIIILVTTMAFNFLSASDSDLHTGNKDISWIAYYNTLSKKEKDEIQHTLKKSEQELAAIKRKNENDINKFDSGWFIIEEPTAAERSNSQRPGLKMIIQNKRSIAPATIFISGALIGYLLHNKS